MSGSRKSGLLDASPRAILLRWDQQRDKRSAFGQTTWRLAGVNRFAPRAVAPSGGEAPRNQGPKRFLPDLEKPVLLPRGKGAGTIAVNRPATW